MQRKIRNVVRNHTPAEIKVREATSNDPWGPSSILMSEISTLTFDVVGRGEVMGIIWKRLNDHGKNWRHVYKSLVLLNFLVRTGSDWVVRECRDNIIAIQTLRDFQYIDNGMDCGLNIREASKKLTDLLKDDRKLKEQRHRSQKSRLGDSRVYSSSFDDLSNEPSYNQSIFKAGLNHQTATYSLNQEDNKIQNGGRKKEEEEDEDEDLKLALALSKEEHEMEEGKRRNDEMRLKMALEESKKTAQLDMNRVETYAPSLVDQDEILSDPWGSQAKGGNIASLLDGYGKEAGLNSLNIHSQNSLDEFEEIMNRGYIKNPSNNDDFSTNHMTAKSSSLGDLLCDLGDGFGYVNNNNNVGNSVNNNDIFASNNNFTNNTMPVFNNSSNNNSNNILSNNNILNNNTTNDDFLNFFETQQQQPSKQNNKKTAEKFLGENANLVDLDQLVTMPTKEAANPFTSNNTNPFAHLKAPKVSLNQLQGATTLPNNQSLFPLTDATNQMPPSLPQQPPVAYNNNYNPFM